MPKKHPTPKTVETLKHDADKRKNIPTAEHQSAISDGPHGGPFPL